MQKQEKQHMLHRIKQRREELGYTQEKFCEQVDIVYSTYTKIENGFQNLTLDNLVKIADKLGLSLDYLVFGKIDIEADAQMLLRFLKTADKTQLRATCDFLEMVINREF